jgi:hypothetical protein
MVLYNIYRYKYYYTLKNIKNILRESLILSENVKQAEKILTMNNIPLDAPEYEYLKTLTSNHPGYLGAIVKLSIRHGKLDKDLGGRIHTSILNMQKFLKYMPKQIPQYDSPQELWGDMNKVQRYVRMLRLAAKLTNDTVKEFLKSWDNVDAINDDDELCIFHFFKSIKKEHQTEFLKSSDRYQDIESFFSGMQEMINDAQTKFKDFESVRATANNIGGAEEIYVDEGEKILLLKINDADAADELGSKAWCFTKDDSYFPSYTKRGENAQYYLYKMGEDVQPKHRMIAFTITPSSTITAAFDRFNSMYPFIQMDVEKLGLSLSKIAPKEEKWSDLG